MSLSVFATQFNGYMDLVEQYIKGLPWGEDTLSESMFYSLLAGGKRIRPVLVLAAAAAVGGNPVEILPAACALELIHTYSLIHDDLPAMDNDDYRRGKLANHKVFGEAMALLAGDALLTYAFELLAQPMPVPAERQLRVVQELAQAAGMNGMVGGQVADLDGEGKSLDIEQIERIHSAKTGAILIGAARCGAILGGGGEQEVKAFTDYARAIGLAFQIKDDILDLEGDSLTLGKPAGSDLRHQKATYPSLLGIEGAKEHLREQIKRAKSSLSFLEEKAEFLNALADYIAQRQH